MTQTKTFKSAWLNNLDEAVNEFLRTIPEAKNVRLHDSNTAAAYVRTIIYEITPI